MKDVNQMDPELEYEEDLYLLELHKRLTGMKVERKNAEKQASILENRLKNLKMEETSKFKKIEVVRNKTNKFYSQLEKMEMSLKQKEQYKNQKMEELNTRKELNKKMKEENQSKIQEQRDQNTNKILEEAKRLREQKKHNEDLLKYIKLEEQNTNKNKYEFIKAQQLLSEERKRAYEIERKNKLKIELENKLLEEQRLKEEAERIGNKLGEEEVETLKRIRQSTQKHKSSKYSFMF